MDNILLNDGEKYSGEYVATASFLSKDVISHGNDLILVYHEAKTKGIQEPVVFYVPDEKMGHIYCAA